MKPAVAYIRESTIDQRLGLDAQREKIAQWCQLHGYTLAAVHTDAGISGKRADNRPGLQAALREVTRNRGSAIVVYSLSRLARSVIDAIRIAERLDKAGCDLVSLSESIDTTTAAGKMIFRMLAVLAEFERDCVSERTTAALATKIARGHRVGSVPYGFTLAADGRQLVADAREQEVIRTIHDLRPTYGLRRIASILDNRGIRPKKGGRRWNQSAVRRILERTNGHAHNAIP